ncbi:MAG: hypothetical protein QM655_13575 [Nocardioidaceae bacterium]
MTAALFECRREVRAAVYRATLGRRVPGEERAGCIETPARRGAPKSRTSLTDPARPAVVSIRASFLGALDQRSPGEEKQS